MKKFKLTFVALIATLGLVACGGEPAASEESKEPAQSQTESKTESKADSKTESKTESKASSEKHVHTFDETKWEKNDNQHWHPATCEHTTQKGSAAAHTLVEDTTKGKPASCKEEGEKVEKCSVCGYEKVTKLSKTAHALGAGVAKSDADGDYLEYECSVCHEKVTNRIKFNTIQMTAGTFEGGKLSQDPVGIGQWKFQLPAGQYDVYFVAKFSSSSGTNRTLSTRQVQVTLNGTQVEFDNTKTAEDLGMSTEEFKTFTFCSITATGGVDTITLQNPNYRFVFDEASYITFSPKLPA